MKRTIAMWLAILVLTGLGPAASGGERGFVIYLRNADDAGRDVHEFDLHGNRWVFGDRVAYRCAYFFLQFEGRHVARVTVQRTDGASYIIVNDRYGEEQHPQTDCPGPAGEYEEGEDKPADLTDTVVRFRSHRDTVDTLRFPATSPVNSSTWFELEKATKRRVQIEVYLDDAAVATVTIKRLSDVVTLRV